MSVRRVLGCDGVGRRPGDGGRSRHRRGVRRRAAGRKCRNEHGEHFRSERACVRYVERAASLFTPRLTPVVFCFSTVRRPGTFASGFHGASAATLTLHGVVFASDHGTVRTVTTAHGSGNLSSGTFIRQSAALTLHEAPAPWAIL